MSEETDWSQWPLTRAAVEQGQAEAYDLGDEDDEDESAVPGNRWLRMLAAESGGAVTRVGPGMWWAGRADGEPPAT